MKPQLIACDVDGTLLPAGQPDLPQSLVSLIARIVDKGIAFVPASGRQFAGLKKLFSPIAGVDSFVAENGAIASVGNDIVYCNSVDRSLGDEIIRFVLSRPECELYVAGVQTCYTQTNNQAYIEHLREDLQFHVTVVEDATAIPEPYLKISAYHADCIPDPTIWQRFNARCNVAVSGPDWVDLAPLGVSKAVGIEAVCKKLGVDPTNCIAFGDADNDIEMLQLVGHSVAMQEGSEATHAAATEIALNVESVLNRILAN